MQFTQLIIILSNIISFNRSHIVACLLFIAYSKPAYLKPALNEAPALDNFDCYSKAFIWIFAYLSMFCVVFNTGLNTEIIVDNAFVNKLISVQVANTVLQRVQIDDPNKQVNHFFLTWMVFFSTVILFFHI